jgi:hypothetical protein
VGCVWILGMKFIDAVILCFLGAPGDIYFAWEEEGIVTVLLEIVAKVLFQGLNC